MAISFVLTFLLIRVLAVPEGVWALITMVVVIGPISFWGNVTVRALQRCMGTVFGAASGLVALYLELYSMSLMLVWCTVVMFVCGIAALGKRPYMGLLIGITLCVVSAAGPGDIQTALLRSVNVIIGSLLALLFASIYPQRAFTHWRLKMNHGLTCMSNIYSAYISPNMVERPQLTEHQQLILSDLGTVRGLLAPSARETKVDKAVFDAIQVITRNLVATLEMMTDAYWASRESHFIMLNATRLRMFQKLTINALHGLSQMLLSGRGEEALEHLPEMEPMVVELKTLIAQAQVHSDREAPIYGYLWLNMQLAMQLDELRDLLSNVLRR
ncbi:FUSC family protein [Edwardsiella ictaluri]|nr:FUSC family protein [Edwardsiella ictaluri]BEI01916.1 FUSC family protein [Edwardsiella ictaluri]BEI05384.1 FUSC family protein [Edwardsiella ictaluri]BEI08843.1 FUSC family protein [Edwardsiella ictaluri]BEI15801.1 FUSC family protein [Edwardsiella ictaluri]